MSKCLSVMEMNEILGSIGHSNHSYYETKLENLAERMSKDIQEHFDVDANEASTSPVEEGGTAVFFYAKKEGDICPEIFHDYDDNDEWVTKDGLPGVLHDPENDEEEGG